MPPITLNPAVSQDKFQRMASNFPPIFNPFGNPGINAMLQAIAAGDTLVSADIANTKDQIFVATASGSYLDRLASGFGVQRPPLLGIADSDFQNLIVALSLTPKQIRSTFYKVLDVFWGPLYSRANIQSENQAPFAVSPGDTLQLSIDGGATVVSKVLVGDIASPGAATAQEIVNVLSRIPSITPIVITNEVTNAQYVNIRTNTPGPVGSIQVLGGTMAGAGELDLPLTLTKIISLPQRTVVYEINNREVIIEIPVTVPILRRELQGSHHFHATSAKEPVNPTSGLSWVGSFMYDPAGGAPYTVTSQRATLVTPLVKGQVYTDITVTGANNLPNAPGYLIADWGLNTQEEPIPYLSIPNSNTILLNPAYIIKETHLAGAQLNFLSALSPLIPTTTGSDYPIYVTDPTSARETVQELLSQVAAAGVIVTYDLLLPEYVYFKVNPYA